MARPKLYNHKTQDNGRPIPKLSLVEKDCQKTQTEQLKLVQLIGVHISICISSVMRILSSDRPSSLLPPPYAAAYDNRSSNTTTIARWATELYKYLSELLGDRHKLGPFLPVLPNCCRLLNQGLLEPSATQNWLSSQGSSSGLIIKRTIRVDIPVDKYPNYNFVGRLLGPRGNSLKRVEEATECRVLIRGRGSIKDPARDESQDFYRKQQLRELAMLNGTFRDEGSPMSGSLSPFNKSWWYKEGKDQGVVDSQYWRALGAYLLVSVSQQLPRHICCCVSQSSNRHRGTGSSMACRF